MSKAFKNMNDQLRDEIYFFSKVKIGSPGGTYQSIQRAMEHLKEFREGEKVVEEIPDVLKKEIDSVLSGEKEVWICDGIKRL